MDLQTYLDNAVQVTRLAKVGQSDQLTLGELIVKLESLIDKRKYLTDNDDEKEPEIVFDFEYLFPTKFDSWRGFYRELALNFTSPASKQQPMKLSEFLALCQSTVGKIFEGYKGGDFTMGKHTPIWVANYGNSGHTALVEVVDADYEIVLITGYRES